MDYLQYDQETYIFETVRSRFEGQGSLNAYDFFSIIIWKANRAKTKIAKRLLKNGKFDNLEDAVLEITTGISNKADHKEVEIRFRSMGFQTPNGYGNLDSIS